MKLSELSISNYRALRNVSIPLSRFGCLIGENNSGKSTFLQAVALFFSGAKLSSSYYFDEKQPIRIAITFEEINDDDLAKLAEEHRTRVEGLIKSGRLVLVRYYDTDGKGSLRYNTQIPNEARFSSASITELVKQQRAGQTFVDKVVSVFPELDGIIDKTMGQNDVKQKIQELADSLPDEQKVSSDQELPTGIDKIIMLMLPVPIYIPAVKDLADEIKTSESASFGKILAILLEAVETKLSDTLKLFEELNEKLNRVYHNDGTITDGRLDEVKIIETTVEKYVRESFKNVTLQISIPPPEMKTVFTSARIFADDGIYGLVETKGDGLRRAIVFAILRSYVELKEHFAVKGTSIEETDQDNKSTRIASTSYFLLFEEPELFLHPKAQNVLFDALREFSRDHHVLVTTHSPMFFAPGATETFIKLHKVSDPKIAARPFTKEQPVDLSDITARDQFQLICFENNNAAFFADVIVLVEGDSDFLLMPHIAKKINPAWDMSKVPVLFVRITGKGNIRRYRAFFSRFGARVPVIADLDLIIQGFDQIDPNEDIIIKRENVLKRVDALIAQTETNPSAKEAKEAHNSRELRSLWQKVKEYRIKLKSGECSQEQYDEVVEDFFDWQRRADRLDILKHSDDVLLLQLKYELFRMLRDKDIFVLERGAIEDYYPDLPPFYGPGAMLVNSEF